jgi:hypothetical protein
VWLCWALTAFAGCHPPGRQRIPAHLRQRLREDFFIAAGAARPVWPALEAVLEEAVAEPKLPAGLPDLIRVLRLNPAAIPSVPVAVRQLASRKGSGQALAEARALVEARPE